MLRIVAFARANSWLFITLLEPIFKALEELLRYYRSEIIESEDKRTGDLVCEVICR